MKQINIQVKGLIAIILFQKYVPYKQLTFIKIRMQNPS